MPETLPGPGIEAMLKTFELTDQTMREQMQAQGVEHKIACKKGCSVCCKNVEMPILSAEIETIGWHIKNRVGRELRRKILNKVDKQKPNSVACPFVINDSCSIYQVRPLACRTYLIMNQACRPGENILETRFDDRVDFESLKMQASLRPLVGLVDENAEKLDTESDDFQRMLGFIISQRVSLSDMDWKGFLKFYMQQK
jgi:Fe-S-cluster containining protein